MNCNCSTENLQKSSYFDRKHEKMEHSKYEMSFYGENSRSLMKLLRIYEQLRKTRSFNEVSFDTWARSKTC